MFKKNLYNINFIVRTPDTITTILDNKYDSVH